MNLQRVAAYRTTFWIEQPNANDKIATEASRGIAELEAWLAEQDTLVSA